MARKRDGAGAEGGADGIPIGDGGPAMGMAAWRRFYGIPGLVSIQKAMENGHRNREIVSFPIQNGGSFHS